MSHWKLFLLFVKIGAVLLGGGYVILPIIISEFSEKRNLVTKEEIMDYYALAQSLPGIVAANISMFIGYKLKGKIGAVTAMFGIIFVPFWIIVILASLISLLDRNIYVKAILSGVGIGVIALILLTIREMWQNTKKDLFFYSIFLAALMFLVYYELSPVTTIIICVLLGFISKYIGLKRNRGENK